jgi:hypothetical protein
MSFVPRPALGPRLRLATAFPLLALLFAAGASSAEPASALDPDNAFLALHLENFFPNPKHENQRLNIYIVRREGRWISAVGTATNKGRPVWNTALMPADPSQLKATTAGISGTIPLTFVADPWVPADQRVRPATITIDASFGPPRNQDVHASLDGTWTVAIPGPEAELAEVRLPAQARGTITGSAGKHAAPDLTDQSYDLMFYNLTPGAKEEAFARRRAISLGVRAGKVVSARVGHVNNRQAVYGLQQIETPTEVSVTPDALAGTMRFPIDFPDGDLGHYELAFSGTPLAGWVVGSFTASYVSEAGRRGEISGFFRGDIRAGAYVPRATGVEPTPWFLPVPGHVPPAPGEHPRLLFRKADVAALRARAATPEGQAIVKRLRETLDGGSGEGMPMHYNRSDRAYGGNGAIEDETQKDDARTAQTADATKVMYTIGHAAGYGMLYQLTGEQRYADLGRHCFEKAFAGVRDRDDRYAWRQPGGALRAGPVVGLYALGYDLCHDGWDPEFRATVARAIQDYDEGPRTSLTSLARGTHHFPGSNHWGAQVGGASLALLAIAGDPGTDEAKVARMLEANARCIPRNLGEGFGDHGWFAEGDGAGTISSDTAFIPALQAWRVAAGKDFTARSNAQWLTMKWVMLTLPVQGGGKAPFPARGAYGHNVWARRGMSGSGTFAQGFGAITDAQKPALLWLYNRTYRDADAKAGQPFDTVNPYPHRSALALVNWPIGIAEADPATVLATAELDRAASFAMFRNRWQDGDDALVTALTQGSQGNHSVAPGEVQVWGLGQRMRFPARVVGEIGRFTPGPHGGTMTVGDGAFGVDFSQASGATVVVVLATATASEPGRDAREKLPEGAASATVVAGPYTYTVLTLGEGGNPPVVVAGAAITVGGQPVVFDGTNLRFGK